MAESRSVQRRKAIQSASGPPAKGPYDPVPASNVSEGLREALGVALDRLTEYVGAAEAGVRGPDDPTEDREFIIEARAALAHAPTERLTCLDYAAHDWNSNGSPSFCRQCWVEWPRLEARRRAGL